MFSISRANIARLVHEIAEDPSTADRFLPLPDAAVKVQTKMEIKRNADAGLVFVDRRLGFDA